MGAALSYSSTLSAICLSIVSGHTGVGRSSANLNHPFEIVPCFLHGSSAQVTFDSGCGVGRALFVIHGKRQFYLGVHPMGDAI
jgi:hypothetical protein